MSPLALQLQKDWLLHRQSAVTVQQYAEVGSASGAKGVDTLADSGLQGYSQKNLSRDVRRKLLPTQMEGPPLYFFEAEGQQRIPMVPSLEKR